MEYLIRHIEALIFCSNSPIKIAEIKKCLDEMFDSDISLSDIETAVHDLQKKYTSDDYAFELVNLSDGYQFLTKPSYQTSIALLLKQQSKKRLSTSSLETLSIIVYKQPITKANVEQIRGVNCDYAIQKLLEKSLIEIKGKADTIGRPLLYGTTDRFMEYFGINTLKDLPTPKDFAQDDNTIGDDLD